MNKDTIYRAVRCAMIMDGKRETMLTGKGCLHWMMHGAIVLHHFGLEAIPQAGSASWRFIPPNLDDGISATHFTNEWSPNEPQSLERLRAGQLPEIHCWLAIPSTREVVDFSTGYIHHAARASGLEWKADPLPPYIWCREGHPHPGTVYVPCREAIEFVLNFLREKAIYANA